MTVRKVLLTVISLVLLNSCEKENWALVDPPPGTDSVRVRYLNFCGDGVARTLSLDSKVNTPQTSDFAASACIDAPADSAFVSILPPSGISYFVSQRLHFAKQSNEILISVPSLSYAPKPKTPDTVVQLSTPRNLLKTKGYGSLRLVVVADDSVASYQMRVGCPNGTELGSNVSIRQSTTYILVPAGNLVVSLIRNGITVGIYKLAISDGLSYSLIAGRFAGKSVVRLLDEFNVTNSAMTTPPSVLTTERVSFVRTVNFSRTALDSVVSTDGSDVSGALAAKTVGDYRTLTACVSDRSDEFRLYSSGQLHQSAQTSMGVLSKYTIVCFDSIRGGGTAAQIAIVPPMVTQTPVDSVSVRVVNTVKSGISIRVRLGARSDESGVFHNGELLCFSDSAGFVSAPLRVAPGIAPITVMSNIPDQPELLLGCFMSSLSRGKEYICVVGDDPLTGGIEVSMIEAGSEKVAVTSLSQGVFAQFVHARSDRATINLSINGLVNSSTLTFTNSLATVVPQGSMQVSANGVAKTLSVDTSRRLTVVLSGVAAKPDVIVLDYPSMRPVRDTSRSRYLNATSDVPSVRFCIDSVNNLGYNVYADAVSYGTVSPTRTESNPHRVNFVCGESPSLREFYRPDYPVTLLAGKSYTVVLCGNTVTGYAFILQQEY